MNWNSPESPFFRSFKVRGFYGKIKSREKRSAAQTRKAEVGEVKVKEDSRYRRANREAVISLGMYVLFFAWWYFTAYGLGSGDPGEYTYVLGLPSWFFYSCIVGYIGISLVVWAVVRLFFSEDSIEGNDPEEAGGPQS
jgi:uncharacterized membrane protein YhdT